VDTDLSEVNVPQLIQDFHTEHFVNTSPALLLYLQKKRLNYLIKARSAMEVLQVFNKLFGWESHTA